MHFDYPLTINNQLYVNLDNVINIDTCPDITEMVAKSYNFLKHNCSIRTFNLWGEPIMDSWYSEEVVGSVLDSNKKIFESEILNKTRSPYYTIKLTLGGKKGYVYDSVDTDYAIWDSIKWNPKIKKTWKPLIEWVNRLPILKRGHVTVFLNRPGVAPEYHVDSGNDADLDLWKPSPHREEFIWINFSPEKNFYIIDHLGKPNKISSKSAFFNTHNYHGSHDPSFSWSFSMRIECIFSDDMRKQMNINNVERYYYE